MLVAVALAVVQVVVDVGGAELGEMINSKLRYFLVCENPKYFTKTSLPVCLYQ